MTNRWRGVGLVGAGVVIGFAAARVEITAASIEVSRQYALVACKQ